MNDPTPPGDTIEQLAEEWRERLRRGERFEADEYIARCPELAEEIRDLFDAIVMMEDLKPVAADLTGAFTGLAGAAAGEARLERLGDFRILREVGRGGMGVVYEAEQESLGRRVALKVLPSVALADRQQKKRFQREARATARLHHTNIVPVYGVGEHEGMSYYVMQFIQGAPLDQVLVELRRLKKTKSTATTKQAIPAAVSAQAPSAEAAAGDVARSLLTGTFQAAEPWKQKDPGSGQRSSSVEMPASGSAASAAGGDGSAPLSESSVRLSGQTGQLSLGDSGRHYYLSVAGIGLQVAEALEHANSQGIIHRDIKPSNLLLDHHGTVWVTDFGLAKALADGENLTHTGDIVGTLRYMAPERFVGVADARGDIYSLGLTLYELLVQQPAFVETDRNRLIHQVTHQEPPPPRKLNPGIPRDLETIVLKACDREPARRYATAGALAEDLKRFLADRPVGARRVSKVERVWRWCRRNPALAAETASVLLLLLVIAVGASLMAVHFQRLAQHEADLRLQAQDALEAAEKASRAAEDARRKEVRQRDQAASAQKLAEENFQEARRAVEQLITRVSEGRLKNLPGMQPVRKELLESALNYYQGFVARHGDDPALKSDLADACSRLAGILEQVGSTREALKIHQQAGRLLADLHRSRHQDRKLTLDLAAHYRALAGLQRRLNDREAALASLDRAYDVLLTISPQDPRRTTSVRVLGGYSHGNVRMHVSGDKTILQAFADVLNDKGAIRQARHPAEAIDYYTQALFIRQSLLRNQPYRAGSTARARYEHDLARQWSLLGGPYAEQHMRAAALQYQREARNYLEHVLRAYPDYPRLEEIKRDLAAIHESMADLHAARNEVKPALELYPKALDYRERQAAENPAVADFQSELTDCLYKLALVQARDRMPDKASESLRRAIGRQQTLVATFPEEKSPVRALAQQWLALARIEREQGKAAAESYRQARGLLETLQMSPASAAAAVGRLIPVTPALPPYLDLLQGDGQDFLTLAAVRAALGEEDAALALLKRAAQRNAIDPAALLAMPELAGLRARRDFVSLLAAIQAKAHVLAWLVDFDDAQARARRENKDLFLYFGSSDSEPTGVWFQRNMLTHPVVAAYLNKYFICVDLDRPRYSAPPPNGAKTWELITRWQASYMATMVLADSQGRAFWRSNRGSSELGRWSSPEEFVKALESQRMIRKMRDRRLAEVKRLSGDLNKAKYLDETLRRVPVYAAIDYQDVYTRICRLDRDNRLGLRARYFPHSLASGREQIRRLIEHHQWKLVLTECQDLLEGVALTGQSLPALYLDRGLAYLALGQFDRAAVDLARGQALYSGNPEHALWLVHALIQVGDAPGYQRACAELLRRYRDTTDPYLLFLVAWTCGMAPDTVTDWSEVIALTQKLPPLWNNNRLAWNALGLLHYRAGHLAEAETALRRSMATDPNWRGRNELILALIEQRRGHSKQARQWLDQVLSFNTRDSLEKPHATGFRDLLVSQQLLEEAVVRCEGPPLEALSALQARRYRGFMHLTQWKRALDVLNKAIAADPDNAQRYLERGRCYEGLAQPEKAAADFATALGLKSRALEKARKRVERGANGFSDGQALEDACRDVAWIQQRSGRPVDAAVTLGSLAQHCQGNASKLLELARDIATLVPRAEGDPATLTAEQRETERRVGDAANSLLKQALEAGYLDGGRVLGDAGFHALLRRDDFRMICNEMAMRSKFATAGGPVPFAAEQPPPAALPRERGRFFARRGKWRQAIAELDLALKQQPGQSEIWRDRGRCHAMLEEWEQAAADFLKSLDLLPEGFGFNSPRGFLCKELAQWEKALDRAVRMRPGDAQLRIGRARFHHLRGQWHEAAAVFSEAIEAHPLWEEWFEASATVALAGQENEQRKLLAEMIHRAGKEPSPFIAYVLARSCSLLPDPPADPAQVVRWAQHAVAERPNAGWYLHVLGTALYRAGNMEQAVHTLQRSMSTGWASPLNHFLLAMAQHHLGNAEDARRWLDRARAQFDVAQPVVPGEPTTAMDTDWLEANVIRQEAEKLLNAPHRREAEDCARQGRWAEAITHLDALLKKDPDFWPDRKRRGEAHARLGHWAEAAADYARVVERQPNNPTWWFEHACLLCQLDDGPGYRKLCSRMHERFVPSRTIDDAVFLAHACVLAPAALGDPAEVVKRAKERLALTAPPNSHNAFSVHVLGLAYYRAGQYGAAIECLNMESGPRDVEQVEVLNRLVLALALAKRDRPTEARQWLDLVNEWLDDNTRKLPPGGAVIPAKWPWRDWLLVWTLHREAQQLLADR
jgi:serine/threonine protein kinase/tetratricopeptide (TPR) repeat protein